MQHSRQLVVSSLPRLSSVIAAFYTQSPHYKEKVTLYDSDLEENFICGWGPGGQKINKTQNCVFLKHIPTGLSVKCQVVNSSYKCIKSIYLQSNQ